MADLFFQTNTLAQHAGTYNSKVRSSCAYEINSFANASEYDSPVRRFKILAMDAKVSKRFPGLDNRQDSCTRIDRVLYDVREEIRCASESRAILAHIVGGENKPATSLPILVNHILHKRGTVPAFLQKIGRKTIKIRGPVVEGLATTSAAHEIPRCCLLYPRPGAVIG